MPAKQRATTRPRSRPSDGKATRRPRGAARRLLLEAARDLFARQDYRSVTTREIADQAGVAEHLLFRHFGSKAALFHEALVVPFTEFVNAFKSRWNSIAPESATEDEIAREFLGALYDLFVEHRGLVMTLWAADTLSEDELAEARLGDIDMALGILGGIGAEGIDIMGIHSHHHELAARSTVAMVAGMAAFGSPFLGGHRLSRDVIVEELTQATLHGFLHRDE